MKRQNTMMRRNAVFAAVVAAALAGPLSAQESASGTASAIAIDSREGALRAIAPRDIGYNPAMGARPVKRVIQREILNELSREILEEKIKTNDTIIIDVIDGQFVFYNPVQANESKN